MKGWGAGALLAIAALCGSTTSCDRSSGKTAPDGLVGSWKLASLEETGADGAPHNADCTGSLVLTSDGRMSVQVMYRETQSPTGPVQYAQGGYEASFGRYEVVEPGRSFTYHVEDALVRKLVGQNQKRLYEVSNGKLVIRPPTTDEHWRVTWERYQGTP
ncbi:MAG: lipocalin-like domain-containing protein [Polyangiaceae bacterium]